MRRYQLSSNQPPREPNRSSSSPTVRYNVTYGKCQKNQAEHVGGYALDGCQAFMPSGANGTLANLVCAACHCHKFYHRFEVHNGPLPPPAQGSSS